MHKFAGFAVILFFASPSLASGPEVPGDYGAARFVTTGKTRAQVASANVTKDQLRFGAVKKTSFGANVESPIPMESISYLEVRTGSNAAKFGLMAGVVGLLSGVLTVVQMDANPDLDDVNRGLVLGLMTGVPAFVGFAVGAGTHKYTPLRAKGEWLVPVE